MTFQELYTEELTRRWADPEYDYCRYIGHTPESLAAKMTESLKKGSANKDSLAIKATCKRLGIKYTYAAIKEHFAFESALDRTNENLGKSLDKLASL